MTSFTRRGFFSFSFFLAFLIIRCGVFIALFGFTWSTAISAHVLCTPYYHAPVYTFIQSHTRRVHICLAVTCHLHVWQNERNLSRATAVALGWNCNRNKSQHRKLTLEKKILLPLLPGIALANFRSRVRCFNHWGKDHLCCVLPVALVTNYCCLPTG